MSKKTQELEIKIFVVSMLLQELLDETQSETWFKHSIKFHIKKTQAELDKLLSVNLSDENLSLFITDAMSALEKSIDDLLVE